jgi:hypothetical protein
MSSAIEGSILTEHHLEMNLGLCAYTNYINVLADETMCDPGSIVAMAGMLGYMACGAEIFDDDADIKPLLHVGRPYSCGESRTYGHSGIFEPAGQRERKFDDVQLAKSSRSMEQFFYVVNKNAGGGENCQHGCMCGTGDAYAGEGHQCITEDLNGCATAEVPFGVFSYTPMACTGGRLNFSRPPCVPYLQQKMIAA